MPSGRISLFCAQTHVYISSYSRWSIVRNNSARPSNLPFSLIIYDQSNRALACASTTSTQTVADIHERNILMMKPTPTGEESCVSARHPPQRTGNRCAFFDMMYVYILAGQHLLVTRHAISYLYIVTTWGSVFGFYVWLNWTTADTCI